MKPKRGTSTKDICNLFFGKLPFDSAKQIWKCSCGMERKCDVSKNGYNNLLSHITSKHPNYLDVVSTMPIDSAMSMSNISEEAQLIFGCQNLLVDTRSSDVYKWLDWIVMDELELSFCEQIRTRGNTNLSKICTKSLKKYMFKLVSAVQNKIKVAAALSQ